MSRFREHFTHRDGAISLIEERIFKKSDTDVHIFQRLSAKKGQQCASSTTASPTPFKRNNNRSTRPVEHAMITWCELNDGGHV